MNTVTREIPNEIMATDIFLSVSSNLNAAEIEKDIEHAVQLLRNFENKYSRFKQDSELTKLNLSESIEVSDEFVEILKTAKEYYHKTKGMFDPAILNTLKNEGYILSKNAGFNELNNQVQTAKKTRIENFEKLEINKNTVTKPKELQIDLGGIGKGYIVDIISKFFKTKYTDFCVDAGGDMFLAGVDIKNKYPYWAIELEDPFIDKHQYQDANINIDLPTFILRDKATATSGINKRKWMFKNEEKHHIIDPIKNQSVQNDLICVTVIGDTTVFCDVMAKVILLKGTTEGLNYCENNNIAATLITKDRKVFMSKEIEKYVWKE